MRPSSVSRSRESLEIPAPAFPEHQFGDDERRQRTGGEPHPGKHVHEDARMAGNFAEDRIPVPGSIDNRRPAANDMNVGESRHDAQREAQIVAQGFANRRMACSRSGGERRASPRR